MTPGRAAVLVLCFALAGSTACALQTRGTGIDVLLPDGTDTDMDPGQPEDAPGDPFDTEDSGTMEEAQEDAVLEVEDETGGGDGQAGEDAADAPDLPGDEIETTEEAVEDPPGHEELPPVCAGPAVGGFCWYASAVNDSCDSACAAHGGCSLAGTRYYAGSDGTDAHCIEVLGALGYGGYTHYGSSNNQFGCQFTWGVTYWSTDLPTNCEDGCPGCAAQVVRMCACNE